MEYQSFGPGHPGFAVTVFVLVIVLGALVAFRLRTKGDYRRAYVVKRRTKAAALAAAFFYICGWAYVALKKVLGV
ncbi:MAG: hypothetical protein P4N41_09495 [Negativicutes bacterium]|nr:hypothetical protein [Negativicutes bacterium]